MSAKILQQSAVAGMRALVSVHAILATVMAAAYAGEPGAANCHGVSVSALAQQFGGIKAAASALGFPSVQALQNVIRAFCRG